jgi:magnesium-transporting ATPase (P-type)
MIIYTGKETKINLNQGKYTFKQSEIEKKLNYILAAHIVMMLSLAGIMSAQLKRSIDTYGTKMRYVFPEEEIDSTSYASYVYATYFIAFNSLVPLAFVIAIEIIKMSYSPMIEHDLELHRYKDPAL